MQNTTKRMRKALEEISNMDPHSYRADDLGRAARIARTALAAQQSDHARAETVPQWLPIESAPKDGTYVLLGSKSGAWIARYCAVYPSGYWPDDPWQSMMLNRDHMPRHDRAPATHWMPLPPEPTK